MVNMAISFVDTSTSAYSLNIEILLLAGTQCNKFMQKVNVLSHEAGKDVGIAQNGSKNLQDC